MRAVTRRIITVSSAVVLLAAGVGACVLPTSPLHVGDASAVTKSHFQHVAPSQSSCWLPSGVGLADSVSYGDQEFSASNGNLAVSSAAAAFGAVASTQSSALDSTDLKDWASAEFGASTGELAEHVMHSDLSSATTGTGLSTSTVSQASTGDVQGLSATSCVSARRDFTFLVPSTQRGHNEIVEVVNPSGKPTAISVDLWTQKGESASQTSSRISVAPRSLARIDLSAAAGRHDALRVRLSSSVASVYAYVKSQASQKLASQGVDYISQPSVASSRLAIAGVREGLATSLVLYSPTKQRIHISWLAQGKPAARADSVTLGAEHVTVIDLKNAPAGVSGLLVSTDAQSSKATQAVVEAMAVQSVSSSGNQKDYVPLPAQLPVASAASVRVDNLNLRFGLANSSDSAVTVTLAQFDDKHQQVKSDTVSIPALSSRLMDDKWLQGSTRSVVLTQQLDKKQPQAGVTFTQQVTSPALDSAHVAGIAALLPTSLVPVSQKVTVVRSPAAASLTR